MLVNNNLRVLRAEGEEIDLVGKQGTTWGPLLIALKIDGVAVNLTGYSVRGQMRKRIAALNPEVGLTFAVSDAAGGVISMSMSAEDSAALTCGSRTADPESCYVWDMEIYKVSPAEVSRFFKGKIYVDAEVTR